MQSRALSPELPPSPVPVVPCEETEVLQEDHATDVFNAEDEDEDEPYVSLTFG